MVWRIAPVVVVLAAAACGDDSAAAPDDASSSTGGSTGSSSSGIDDSATSSSSSTTAAESSSGGSESSSGESSTSSSESSSSGGSTGEGVCQLDIPANACTAPDGVVDPCSTFTQDCAAGSKCVGVTGPMGFSDTTTCVPLADDPGQLGDPCSGDPATPEQDDDCDVGLDCTLGVCMEACSCSAATPVCEDTPNAWCALNTGGLGGICAAYCNPLDPTTCAEDEMCFSPLPGYPFLCMTDASAAGEGEPGDACTFMQSCHHGSACTGAQNVPGCAGQSCCTSFCSLADGTGCLEGQECFSWYGPGDAPDDCMADVGLCAIP